MTGTVEELAERLVEQETCARVIRGIVTGTVRLPSSVDERLLIKVLSDTVIRHADAGQAWAERQAAPLRVVRPTD